jgi:hypothetical protein
MGDLLFLQANQIMAIAGELAHLCRSYGPFVVTALHRAGNIEAMTRGVALTEGSAELIWSPAAPDRSFHGRRDAGQPD